MGMGGDNREPMGQQRRQQQYPPGPGIGGAGRPSGPPPGLGYQGTGYGAPSGPGRTMMPGQGLGPGQQQYPGGGSSPAPPATAGFLGKLKSLFASDEGATGQGPPSFPPGQGLGQSGSPFGNRPPPPPSPGMQHVQGLGHQQSYGYPGGAQGQGLGQAPGMPPLPPPLPTQQQQQQQQYGGYPSGPGLAQRQGLDEPQIILDGGGSSAASVSAGLDQGRGLGQPPLPTFPGMSMSEQQQRQQQQQQQSPSDGSSLAAAMITTDPQVDWPQPFLPHTSNLLSMARTPY